MKKIFYEKRGRRYVPVSEYDENLMRSFGNGAHLVMCYPGGESTRYNIDPAYAPMIAAGRIAEDAICKAMVKASELRPSKTPITERQRKAWAELAASFGQEMYTLNGVSTNDIVQAGVKAMQIEADKLFQHQAVKEAFEQFLTVVKLCSDYQEHK